MFGRHIHIFTMQLQYQQHQISLRSLEFLLAELADVQDSITPVNHRVPLVNSRAGLEALLEPYLNRYIREFRPLDLLGQATLVFKDCWANFVGPGQSTPIHYHGGIVSWCLWVVVPYTRSEELAARPWIPDANNLAGDFCFHWADGQGRIQTRPMGVYSSPHAQLCLWPASLAHSVDPFYSTDRIRVSVAGNYWLGPSPVQAQQTN